MSFDSVKEKFDNIQTLELYGNSMWPYLKKNDLIYWLPQTSLEPGDIAILKKPQDQKVIVHRFLGDNQTKGDNEKWTDQQVHPEISIIGKAIYRQRVTRRESLIKVENIHFLKKIKSQLNKKNTFKNPVIHRVYSLNLRLCNLLSRFYEFFTYKNRGLS